MAPSESGFELRGINHLALVCSDMARTVAFYTGVLGMPLIKTIELPAGMGQHLFFDCGNGDALAFSGSPMLPIRPPVSPPRSGDPIRAASTVPSPG